MADDCSKNCSCETQRSHHDQFWKALVTEFGGTFILVLFGGGTVAALDLMFNDPTASTNLITIVVSAIIFGLVLLVLIYLFASVSGALFNPAVTFAYVLNNRMSWQLGLIYGVAQLAGGVLAAWVIWWLFSPASGAAVGAFTETDGWRAFLVEMVVSFFLILAILFLLVPTGNNCLPVVNFTDGSYRLGVSLIIGLVLMASLIVAGYPTGGGLNPARTLGTNLFGGYGSSIWLYLLAPLVGGLLAGLVYALSKVVWADSCPRNPESKTKSTRKHKKTTFIGGIIYNGRSAENTDDLEVDLDDR